MKDFPNIVKLFFIMAAFFLVKILGIGLIKLNFFIYENHIKNYLLNSISAGTPILLRLKYFSHALLYLYAEIIFLMIQFWVLQKIFPFLKFIYLAVRKVAIFPLSLLINFFRKNINFNLLSKGKILTNNLKKITLQTKKGDIYIPNPFRGILVIGGAGSGKSESFAVPLIREFSKQNFTGIVYDFKFPTLAQEVEDYYTENNSSVKRYYLNLHNPLNSHRVNPLHPSYMPIAAFAREYASAITKNLMKESIRKEDFWSRSATDLLTACIWYLKLEHPRYCDLPHVLALIASPYQDLIKLLATNMEVRAMIVSLVTAVESEASEQIAGVVGSLQGAVAQINTPEFMYILGGDDFYLGVNEAEHSSVVVVGSNPSIASTIAPICSLIISVSSKLMNQPGKEKSFIMLDESPTVFIPNIEVIPNTGRSNKISTVLFVQDLSQLVDGYGKEKADVLFASCAIHFYGKVSSSQTADALSKQFGKEDKYFESRSVNRKSDNIIQRSIGKSYSIQQREVFQSSDFMNLSVGEFVGNIAETEDPFILTQFLMSKKSVKTEITSKIPTHERIEIYAFYKKVFQDVERILNGKTELYDEQVNRKELIKKIEKTDEEVTENNETVIPEDSKTPEAILEEVKKITSLGYGINDDFSFEKQRNEPVVDSEALFRENIESLKNSAQNKSFDMKKD